MQQPKLFHCASLLRAHCSTLLVASFSRHELVAAFAIHVLVAAFTTRLVIAPFRVNLLLPSASVQPLVPTFMIHLLEGASTIQWNTVKDTHQQ